MPEDSTVTHDGGSSAGRYNHRLQFKSYLTVLIQIRLCWSKCSLLFIEHQVAWNAMSALHNNHCLRTLRLSIQGWCPKDLSVVTQKRVSRLRHMTCRAHTCWHRGRSCFIVCTAIPGWDCSHRYERRHCNTQWGLFQSLICRIWWCHILRHHIPVYDGATCDAHAPQCSNGSCNIACFTTRL